MSQLFTSGGQSIGISASASVLPVNIQGWSPLGWTGWISLQSKGLSSLVQHHSSKASILQCSAFFIVQLSHPCMTTGKTIALTRWTFVGKVMSLVFNMLSRLVITFLPRNKHLLISWVSFKPLSMVLIVVLLCIFLIISNIEHVFMYQLSICMSVLEKWSWSVMSYLKKFNSILFIDCLLCAWHFAVPGLTHVCEILALISGTIQ